ncbi:threonine-phosphate decarboxylase [Thalassospira sp. NFXS8]|uniref:threonine-phosphate decarboxylase CobD n=1 Tax=Thalassospira sp. NFXS8 TaxID=2819093 RepID=UPI0032DFD32E
MNNDIFRHGGAIDLAAAHYNIALSQWLDLSTGINPTPYPVEGTNIAPETWQRLPLKRDTDAAICAARHYYDVPSVNHIACGPGTQALLQLVPFILSETDQVKRVAIFGPTYGEHAPAWERAHVTTTEIFATPDIRQTIVRNQQLAPTSRIKNAPANNAVSNFGWLGLTPVETLANIVNDHDAFVIVNPNNPDGGYFDRQSLFDFACYLQERGKYLILDEAFADTTPDLSLCPQVHHLTHTVILRSFGKFFGLAGARVGFALSHPALIAKISDRLGPWAVPGPALHIATAALGDNEWHHAMRTSLHLQANWLDQQLSKINGCKLIGGTDLLRLYQGEMLPALQKHLAQCGIWVRGFTQAPTWLRFGLPGTKENQNRLQTALESFCP